jgi:glycosyltransferase involved in cell wall biosynthesis
MISVITPVYNGEKFIESCIQNVIDQNCNEIEHIIIDGGSTDKTVDVIQDYASRYPHIRWISEKDKGQSDAMNKAIRIANGKVIGILNVDDYYEPNTLSTVKQLFENLPEPTLLVGNCHVWTEGNRSWISRPHHLSFTNILIGRTHLVNPAAYFYHTSLHQQIGDYKLDEHYALDLDFVIRAAKVANLKYVNINFGNYRMYTETKTMQDIQDGLANQRKQRYLDQHTNALDLPQRLKTMGLRQLFNWYRTARSWI